MVLGYVIFGPDNKYIMYKNLHLDKCSRYKDVYSINLIDPNLLFKKIKYNFSHTYDGFAIVSEAFKRFCEEQRYDDLEFVDVSGGRNFYWLKAHRVVGFDTKARGTRFTNYSIECDGYEEIIGATPVLLTEEKALSDGICRTDVCFGSYAGKSPLYLIGEATRKKMESAGFDDIDFEEIRSKGADH